jgi:hypothetical protein
MAENNNYDMQRLQQDAIRRAREMQSRAQINTVPVTRPTPKPTIPIQEAQPRNRPDQSPPAPAPKTSRSEPRSEQHEPPKGLGPITDIFEMLFSDTERTLILALILLLVDEKADASLIFALMYLAM